MSATPNPLDQLLARAQAVVREKQAADVAKAKAKDGKAPASVRARAQAEYNEWAERQVWALVGKERVRVTLRCKCGSEHLSSQVLFFAVYEHRITASTRREVACAKFDHPTLPVRMKSMEQRIDYCGDCS